MRILHFSDLHLRQRWREVPLKDWFGKRAIGGINLVLGRASAFDEAPEKTASLGRFCNELGVDFAIFTGDYTALGIDSELRMARAAVAPLVEAPLGYANVPGNHDLYSLDVVREGRFERHFGDTLQTDMPEYRVDNTPWPIVRLVGREVAVVGVNSARPNPIPWRASTGKIPPEQLLRLRRILADTRLQGRFVFVITHYAPRLANGEPDRLTHGMLNADAFLEACANLPRGAMLCGHVHWCYMLRIEGVRPPLFCAGSATKTGVEGLWVFDIEGGRARATPGVWTGEDYALETGAAVDL